MRPDKDRPSAEWIASLRRKFPTEPQIDQILTRKMERRAGPGYAPVSLDALKQGLHSLIGSQIQSRFSITNTRWLSGGASKIQMAFDLDWERPGVGRETTGMVLRMEPAESIVATSRVREFQLIRAVRDIVPVPPVFWFDANGEHLPYPALVYGMMPGVTKPSNTNTRVSGLGTLLAPQMREKLAPQFIEHLARIHSLDYRTADLTEFTAPAPGLQCAEWGVNWWERVWEEDSDEDIPMIRLAAAWLRRNMPVMDRPSIVHSDYRVGNFLFTEDDMRITALLDWELGRIGDRHQDIAWTTSRTFGGLDADGKTFLVCNLISEPAFYDAYEAAAGLPIDRRTVKWYQVYNNFSIAVLVYATGYRVARNGKTHQDVLVSWLMGIGGVVLEQMREQIEGGC